MEAAKCDLCGTNDFDVVGMERFRQYGKNAWNPVVTVTCRKCGHVFSSPRMTSQEVSAHYENQYSESFRTPKGERLGLYEREAQIITRTIGDIEGQLALEIGCYSGYMLNHLREEGWKVEGLEPNPDSAAVAREKFGFTVHEELLENFNPDRRYDLIVMGAVLEHVREPTGVLLKINKLLKPDGHIFIRVPDVCKINMHTIADVFTPEHPNMYSPETLRMFYQKTGFNEVRDERHEESNRHILSIAQKTTPVTKPVNIKIKSQYNKHKKILSDYYEHLDRERERVNSIFEPLVQSPKSNIGIYGAGQHTEFLFKKNNN